MKWYHFVAELLAQSCNHIVEVNSFFINSSDGNLTYTLMSKVILRWNGNWQTNAVTGPSTGTVGGCSATVTESSYGPRRGWKVFDGDNSTTWATASSKFDATSPYDANSGGEWVSVDLGACAPQVTGMRVTGWFATGVYVPDDFLLEGSSNNSTWVTINGSPSTDVLNTERTYTWTWTN